MKRILLTIIMMCCMMIGCNQENLGNEEAEESVIEQSVSQQNATEEYSSQQSSLDENTTVQENDDENQITNDVQGNGVQEGDAYVIFKEILIIILWIILVRIVFS